MCRIDLLEVNMNGYIAFYNDKQIEIRASSLYAAKLEAVKQLKVPKSKQGLLAVVLAEKDGKQVVHTPDF